MPKHTINLDNESQKIYRKINKLRKYGWFSRDIQNLLKIKYGTSKKILVQILNDKQKQRNKLDDDIKKIAKRINKLED